MSVLIGIALKSLLIAGLTLGLLQLLKSRSAAERSWVAHIGLLALVIMAFAPLVLPSWNVEAPALLASAAGPASVVQTTAAPAAFGLAVPGAGPVASPVTEPVLPSLSPLAAATALYAVPAAILLLITFLALARLIALRARADVLVDGHWLSALARAQRRMGFKHGTALLTSNELASPISWGLMRPVILFDAIISTIGTFNLFAEPFVLFGQDGGIGQAGLVTGTLLYKNAFVYFKFGYGAALAWVLALIIFVLSMIQLKLGSREAD